MKNLKKYFIYSIFILFLTNGSCIKHKVPTGDNTFSCYIDGDLFLPKGSNSITTPGGPVGDGLTTLVNESRLAITASNDNSCIVFFNIVNYEVGEFNLTASNGNLYNYSYNHALILKDDVKYLSKENSGTVTIIESYYPSSGGIRGSFEFTLYNENDENDVIHVTDGQFDD